MAVFHHLAHSAFFHLARIEMQMERGKRPFARTPIAHLDLAHWLGPLCQAAPKPKVPQQPHRPQCQRIAAPVKTSLRQHSLRRGIDHTTGQPRTRQRESKRGAIQASTNDQDIGIMFHTDRYACQRGIVHAPECR